MKSEIREITPSIAKEMLKRNANNRPLKEGHVKLLSKSMKNGEWLFDGQPIRFSEGGTLLDGQHRLSAIVDSKIPQNLLIITGIEKEAFKVMDTGKNRSGSDCVAIEGYSNPNEVAASVKTILNIKNNITTAGGNSKVTNTQILKWLESNGGETFITNTKKSISLSVNFSRILSASTINSFWYLFAEKNVEQAEAFISKLCYGLGLETNSPIYVLRKKLMDDKLSFKKIPRRSKYAMIIKAWNLFRKGKECKSLRWSPENEDFPSIL